MYAFCRELEVPVIAEGVETRAERDALASDGQNSADRPGREPCLQVPGMC